MLGGPLDVRILAGPDGQQDVALGEDAHAVQLGVPNHRGPDVAPGHHGACLAQGVMRTDDKHLGAHAVTDDHGEPPPSDVGTLQSSLAWRTRQDKRGEPRWQTVPMPPMSDVAIVGRVSSIPPALVDVLARSGADLFVAGVVLAWVPLVLVLDRSATLGVQHLLGLGTWALLVALLSREDPLVRAQTAVVVVFATAVEYTFSPLLEVYVYRLDNVPAYVPRGTGWSTCVRSRSDGPPCSARTPVSSSC